jgi:hypothetical protein
MPLELQSAIFQFAIEPERTRSGSS